MALKHPGIIALIAIVLLAVAAASIYEFSGKQQTKTTNSSSESSTTDTSNTNSKSSTSSTTTTTVRVYKDGEYSATGSYTTPGGSETIKVTVSLSGDTITAVNATGSATRGDSAEYQSEFLSAYKTLVVGKSVDSVSLSRVAGSSLTSAGFNKALESIKNEAKA